MAYLRELNRLADQLDAPNAKAAPDASRDCFLSAYWSAPENDHANHVVYRNDHGMLLLNRYPYANGHLLAALSEARPTLLDYEDAQRAEFWKLVDLGVDLVRRALAPQGINIGVNEGSAAGAGVPDHLHAHIVPRWAGDTNFMTVVAQVRVMPDSLEAMAEHYRQTMSGKGSSGSRV
jgi:ATP adenylyltransferase